MSIDKNFQVGDIVTTFFVHSKKTDHEIGIITKIDANQVAYISWIGHRVRNKFIPYNSYYEVDQYSEWLVKIQDYKQLRDKIINN